MYYDKINDYLNRTETAKLIPHIYFDSFCQYKVKFADLTEENVTEDIYKIFLLFKDFMDEVHIHGFVMATLAFRDAKINGRKNKFDSVYGSNVYMLKEDSIRPSTKIRLLNVIGNIILSDKNTISSDVEYTNAHTHKINKNAFLKYFEENPDEMQKFNDLISEKDYVERVIDNKRNFSRETYKIFQTDYLPTVPTKTLEKIIDIYFRNGRAKKLELCALLYSHATGLTMSSYKLLRMIDKKYRNKFNDVQITILHDIIKKSKLIYPGN